jgi:hexosaminidase
VIPRPAHSQRRGPGTTLADGMAVCTDGSEARSVGALLANELAAATGWAVHQQGPDVRSPHGTVSLRLGPVSGPQGTGPESYSLDVGPDGVEITAPSPAGLFYGTRTLRQILPPELLRAAPSRPWATVAVEGWTIEDWPRFSWRGLHLDVSRHFFPKDFVLKLVDLAALHKFNRLHLHLTDDQGWRVQIDQYPLLTDVGAWRRESPVGHYREGHTDGTPHGGFYTKADLAEIVAYAGRRFITVVPEIDMPGHMQAAIAAYPHLGNTPEQLEVFTNWGVSDHVLNMEAPTVRFCADVLEEVMDIFPGPYVHIGGDECPVTEWEASPQAQARAAGLGLPGPAALQGWFTAEMAKVLSARGRVLVGWDEVLDAGAPPEAVMMVWRRDEALSSSSRAAREGHDVVMAAEPWMYFDWSYADSPAEPLAIRPAISVEKVYSFEPVPTGLPEALQHHIIGAQCQLWTEYVSTPQHAEYMYFPRACALAEAVWSGADRQWDDFERRLQEHTTRLDALGVNYRPLQGPTLGQARTWSRPTPPNNHGAHSRD